MLLELLADSAVEWVMLYLFAFLMVLFSVTISGVLLWTFLGIVYNTRFQQLRQWLIQYGIGRSFGSARVTVMLNCF